MLADLPYGMQTWVSEGGLNLSKSQRQRIALARSLMGNPPILLLDEPTLGLDTAAKQMFATTLRRFDGTVLLATQDPQELTLADRIVVLSKGTIAEVISGEEYRDRVWLESNLPALPSAPTIATLDGTRQATLSQAPGPENDVR
jgi:ABC-type multidrug transport system fused ATPase/permease subunit